MAVVSCSWSRGGGAEIIVSADGVIDAVHYFGSAGTRAYSYELGTASVLCKVPIAIVDIACLLLLQL